MGVRTPVRYHESMALRLLDRFLNEPVQVSPAFLSDGMGGAAETVEEVRRVAERAEAFWIQNVADYLYSLILDDGRTNWDWFRDFPNVAPPFEVAWYEYARNEDDGVFRVAALISSNRSDEGWSSEVDVVIDDGDVIWLYPTVAECDIDPDGTLEGLTNHSAANVESFSMMIAMMPTLLAISFLHCKNVVTEREKVPEKLRRARQRRLGRPPVRYQTLTIEPMRQVLEREGGASRQGLAKALHICRGHFADYREGRGLFGKHHGVYWVDSHVRGRDRKRAVVKDYAVRGSPERFEGARQQLDES